MVVYLPVSLIFSNILSHPSIANPCILSYTEVSRPLQKFKCQTAEGIVWGMTVKCTVGLALQWCSAGFDPLPREKPADPEYLSRSLSLFWDFCHNWGGALPLYLPLSCPLTFICFPLFCASALNSRVWALALFWKVSVMLIVRLAPWVKGSHRFLAGLWHSSAWQV